MPDWEFCFNYRVQSIQTSKTVQDYVEINIKLMNKRKQISSSLLAFITDYVRCENLETDLQDPTVYKNVEHLNQVYGLCLCLVFVDNM